MKVIQKSMKKFLLIACFFALNSNAAPIKSLDDWFDSQARIAKLRLLLNISPKGTRPGAVIASPSRKDPDYFYHWVRDAALVIDVVRQLSLREPGNGEYKQIFIDFVEFSRFNQAQDAWGGLGEPKYYVDGMPYRGPWGRPQNDGPALRALAMMRWQSVPLSLAPIFTFANDVWPVILTDLDYVVEHWRSPSFDLWEEIKGDHFYTRVVQYAALYRGAQNATNFGDLERARVYNQEAEKILNTLPQHYSHVLNYHVENLNRVEGIHYKSSGLDTATLLAVLHTAEENVIAINDPNLANTVSEYERVFGNLYWINRIKADLSPALGRYPEDQYYGGNPWFLTTAAMAEYYYRLAENKALKSKDLTYARRAIVMGDNFMMRFKYHVDEYGSVAEQMDRYSGFMVSARDLTWSYASFLTAFWARERAIHATSSR